MNRSRGIAIDLRRCVVYVLVVLTFQLSTAENGHAQDRNDSQAKTDATTEEVSQMKVAAIVTTFFSDSHASHIVSKFLQGFPTDDELVAPHSKIASLYIDQIHEGDVGRQIAHKFDIPIYESIRGALTLGTNELAVDAVLLIAEHGDYSISQLGQEMLPRRYFFEQIVGVIGQSDRTIPIFSDKHFAYRWEDAKWMYDTTKAMQIPFWAGSAMPVVWRNPNWEHPMGEAIDEAMVVSFHMVERYGFHALEILQSNVERRRGGETGVRAVQCLSGEDVWKAEQQGKWSLKLANQALVQIENGPGELDPTKVRNPHVFLIEYVDGLQAAVLMLGDGYIRKHSYAQQRDGTIDALEYNTQSGGRVLAFGYMALNIDRFFRSGILPNAIERTYLTTGMLEAAMISRGRGGERVETPHLESIQYQPRETAVRPSNPRPVGLSLMVWPKLEPGATPAATSIRTNRDGTIGGRKSQNER
ncbi:MAG: hypothetical protein MK179_08030 [Pirellulaceae bacterium]|nr:hypothetical protein [Pirellulaceae bacterium]